MYSLMLFPQTYSWLHPLSFLSPLYPSPCPFSQAIKYKIKYHIQGTLTDTTFSDLSVIYSVHCIFWCGCSSGGRAGRKVGVSIPGCSSLHALGKLLNPELLSFGSIGVCICVNVRQKALKCRKKCLYKWVNEACCIKHFKLSVHLLPFSIVNYILKVIFCE